MNSDFAKKEIERIIREAEESHKKIQDRSAEIAKSIQHIHSPNCICAICQERYEKLNKCLEKNV